MCVEAKTNRVSLVCPDLNTIEQLLDELWRPGGGGEGTLIFSHIRRLGPFFWVQNSEFQYFFGFSEK